jgi:hypothetical protein
MRPLFPTQAFDPATLGVLRSIFDELWTEFEPRTTKADRDATRELLAMAIIALAKAGHRDPDRITIQARCKARGL